jgi:hypothetical protein
MRLWIQELSEPEPDRGASVVCSRSATQQNQGKPQHDDIMKNLTKNTIQTVAALVPLTIASALLGAAAISANSNLPTDLLPVPTSVIPDSGVRIYGLAQWPLCPPLPGSAWMSHTNLQFYYSASQNALFMDNREEVTMNILLQATSGTTGDTMAPDFGFGPLVDYSTNFTDLWLSIPWSTNCPGSNEVAVLLHNTTNSLLYNLVSHSNLADGLSCTNWPSQAVLWGAPSTNVTATSIQMDGTSNLFFWAYSITNSPITVQLDSARNASGFVNGVSNFFDYGSTVTINPVLHSLVMGYDGVDRDGILYPDPNPFAYEYISNQGVTAVALPDNARLTITNLFLSHNTGLTTLDVANCQKLTDLELYECSSLTSISLTNCPALNRACVEACNLQGTLDLSGCPNLVDIRSASNAGLTNYHFGPGGAGPLVRHFCARTNPQFNPNIASSLLTNFYSLSEWYMWNCSQTGAAAPVSTNLYDVQIQFNALESANFTHQGNLWKILINDNALTNLLVGDCNNLRWLKAQNNRLTTSALDSVITNLTSMGGTYGNLDLSGNPEFPSVVGLQAADYLRTNLHWSVSLDTRGTGTAGDTDSVTFVVRTPPGTSDVTMVLQTNSPATITWHWSDGYTTNGATTVTYRFTNLTAYPKLNTNYVTVSPPSAAYIFGKYQDDPPQGIVGIYSVSNFPNLWMLYLYDDDVQYLNLANCGSLRELHLAGNPVSPAVCDQWFADMVAACPNPVETNSTHFYYPDIATSASLTNRQTLANRNWTLIPY